MKDIDENTTAAWARSHETNIEIAEAIIWIAKTWDNAENIWEALPDERTFIAIWERATKNGTIEDDTLWWGDTTLYSIRRDYEDEFQHPLTVKGL